MGPEARINLAALRHNLQRVREAAPGNRLFAVVKANAYGHGVERLLPGLDSADALALARVEEALQLRRLGCDKPMLSLGGFFDAEELKAANEQGVQVAINSLRQLDILLASGELPRTRLWLKLDSGMHRLGLLPHECEQALQRLRSSGYQDTHLGLMTHLACADERDDDTTGEQVSCFNRVAKSFRGGRCIANSAGILGWPATHADWVRPGLMLYGASPFSDSLAADEGLQAVMTLSSRLMAVKPLDAGDSIGYGATWRCPEAMTVGVVAMGYGDGYPRHAPSGTPVLVNGQEVPLVGRVSMDSLCVDLRGQPSAQVGDPVVLWGDGLPAERIARAAGTIPYTLFCGVTSRVRFITEE